MSALLVLAALLLPPGGPPPVAAQEHEAFRVALTGKFPPFSFYNEEGKLAGFDVDISRAIADKMGAELKLVATEWDAILPGLMAGKYDAVISSMAITPERAEAVLFSDCYYRSGAQLFIHRDRAGEISSIADCAGKKIGVCLGETYEHFLRNQHPEVETATYKSPVEIFQDMENGRIVGFVTDRLVGSYQIKNAGRPFVPAGDLLYRENIAIPVTRDHRELLGRINRALAEIRASGQWQRLYDRYFGLDGDASAKKSATAMPVDIILKKLAKGFGITLLVAGVAILCGFVLAVPWGVLLNRARGMARFLARACNDFIRGTPVLIQLLFVYFGLGSEQVGLNLTPLQAALITMTVNAAAYMAEVVRAGLMSVDRGQALAARALGMTRVQTFLHVIWPQAFRIAIPPLMNSVVALLKDTALISVITVSEVIREAQTIISVTFEPAKYYLVVAVMFFLVAFPLMKLAGYLEKRIKQKGFAYD